MTRARALATLLAIAACSTAPSISFDDFASKKLEAQCERYVRCGLFESAEVCRAYFYPIADASLAAAIKAKQVRYDGAAAKQCVDALADVTCDATDREARDEPDACASVFSGTIADGDTCAVDAECTSGACGSGAACAPSMCCPETCVDTPPAAIGQACLLDRDCVAETYCGADHLCHALGQENATCYADNQCAYGLGCTMQTFPGICHALPGEGEACPYGRCALIGDVCNAAGTCVPAGLAGAPCTTANDCSPTETCDMASGTCADLPDIGAPCTGTCAGDAWCDTMNRCEARLSDTTPCDTDNDCVSGYCEEGPAFDSCQERAVCH